MSLLGLALLKLRRLLAYVFGPTACATRRHRRCTLALTAVRTPHLRRYFSFTCDGVFSRFPLQSKRRLSGLRLRCVTFPAHTIKRLVSRGSFDVCDRRILASYLARTRCFNVPSTPASSIAILIFASRPSSRFKPGFIQAAERLFGRGRVQRRQSKLRLFIYLACSLVEAC